MSLVEKEVTLNNIELAKNHPEFQKRQEIENKLVPVDPEKFEAYKQFAIPIEQIYLSKLGEEFSLRVRCTYTPEGPEYTATLKDHGKVEGGIRKRLEIETIISEDSFNYYAAKGSEYPKLRQLRATLSSSTTIDYIDGLSHPIIEVETADTLERQVAMESLDAEVIDRTNDPTLDKEYLAHKITGTEKDTYSPETLDAFCERVANEMVALYVAGRNQVVVGITGMSGSGKSTVTAAIQKLITEKIGQHYQPTILSTDDYHRGKKWLEETYGAPWTNWDEARVYDTKTLARDLQQFADGTPLIRRHFDFQKEETVLDQEVQPTPFVILEGLHAGSTDLQNVRHLHFDIPTGIATSIGRDVRRLLIEDRANRAFPTPESRLQYQIETALPTYLGQENPTPNTFNASMRPMASRAFMLASLTEQA